jgi:DNA-directed RNA polymerase subunit RPC12/RpoP
MTAPKTFICSQCSRVLTPVARANRVEGLATHSIAAPNAGGGFTTHIIYLCPECGASMSKDAKDALALANYASRG